MGKPYTPKPSHTPPPTQGAASPSLPPGRWMRVQKTRENGVYGYVLDELKQGEDGGLFVERLHGPDIHSITTFRMEQEALDQ